MSAVAAFGREEVEAHGRAIRAWGSWSLAWGLGARERAFGGVGQFSPMRLGTYHLMKFVRPRMVFMFRDAHVDFIFVSEMLFHHPVALTEVG